MFLTPTQRGHIGQDPLPALCALGPPDRPSPSHPMPHPPSLPQRSVCFPRLRVSHGLCPSLIPPCFILLVLLAQLLLGCVRVPKPAASSRAGLQVRTVVSLPSLKPLDVFTFLKVSPPASQVQTLWGLVFPLWVLKVVGCSSSPCLWPLPVGGQSRWVCFSALRVGLLLHRPLASVGCPGGPVLPVLRSFSELVVQIELLSCCVHGMRWLQDSHSLPSSLLLLRLLLLF